MRSKVSMLSAVSVLSVVLVALWSAAAQAAPGVPRQASKVINLSGSVDGDPGQILPLYTVPLATYLVVTDAEILADGCNQTADLVERLGQEVTTKRGRDSFLHDCEAGTPYRPNIGLVFGPGSEIAIRAGNGLVQYEITGVLKSQ